MKLLAIRLQDFRQFKGEQNFVLSRGSERPVTLLFGANGSGKTTLLNAFNWALYGRMSEDVEQQSRMVNDTTWADAAVGDEVRAVVEVDFEHAGSTYRVLREAIQNKDSDSAEQIELQPRLSVYETRPDGTTERIEAGQSKIDLILPPRLSRFFFFNGERIERLVQRQAHAEVRDDVKLLLGLEHVERAIRDLPKVQKKLGADVRKYGGDQAARLQADIEKQRDLQESAAANIAQLDRDRQVLLEELDEVKARLLNHSEIAPIQQERNRVERDLALARDEREKSSHELNDIVAQQGFIAFCGPVSRRATELAEALYERGALPAPLKREFVDELIQKGECICGTRLEEGTHTWEQVLSWRERAGLKEVESAWQRLSGRMEDLGKARDRIRGDLHLAATRVEESQGRVESLENRLGELKAKLDRMGTVHEDVDALNRRRGELEQRLGELKLRLTMEQEQSAVAKAEEDRLGRELDRAEVADQIAAKSRRRQAVAKSVLRALQEILEIREERMRARLDEKIKQVFSQVYLRDHTPELSSGFELTLRDEHGLEVGRSTGENQLLSLSFVSAVSQLAREVASEHIAEGGRGDEWGEYPIVMDAAFGSLDENYQRDVSRALAEMAPQLVVLVSKSQGLGHVYQQLRNHVDSMGVIVLHTTHSARAAEALELDGRAYPYIRTGEESDWSELREVEV